MHLKSYFLFIIVTRGCTNYTSIPSRPYYKITYKFFLGSIYKNTSQLFRCSYCLKIFFIIQFIVLFFMLVDVFNVCPREFNSVDMNNV